MNRRGLGLWCGRRLLYGWQGT